MGEAPQGLSKGKRAAREPEIVPLDECAQCAFLGHSLHRTRNDPYPIGFFKVMIGPDWNQFMLLPPKFKGAVMDLVGRETVLTDCMGEKWTVTLSSSSEGLGFRRGWQAFVLDHNITMGDFLVFNYIRGSHFTFQIFGRSGCEKKCSSHRFKETTQAKPCEHVNSDATDIQIFSISDASGSKFQPSAARGTLDPGSGNVKPPCFYNSSSLMIGQDRPSQGDLSNFEMHKSNDWSSPCAKENSGRKFTGDIMATKEQQRTIGHSYSRAKRKRVSPLRYADSICEQVKLEPLDVPTSYVSPVTCLAVTDGRNYLELPAKLPDARFRKGAGESKSIMLKDQEERLWPALYHQKSIVRVLISKWDQVNRKNGIQTGDRYVFKVENSSEAIYKIDVHRQ